jgi:hypothetical protein
MQSKKGISNTFATPTLEGVGGQQHASATLPSERPVIHCTGDWMGVKAGVDGHRKSHPRRDSIPGPYSL